MEWATPPPTSVPPAAIAAFVARERPTAPADCKTATVVPAATEPPLAIAVEDIIDAAMEPAAMPPAVNPTAAKASGAAHRQAVPPTAAPTIIFFMVEIFSSSSGTTCIGQGAELCVTGSY